MSAKSIITNAYRDYDGRRRRKNKAKQSQFQTEDGGQMTENGIPKVFSRGQCPRLGQRLVMMIRKMMESLHKAGIGRYYDGSVCRCGSTASMSIYGFKG